MENDTAFRQRFSSYLRKLTPSKVVGAGGLALLSASAILAYDPSAAPLAVWLGSLGLNVLASVGQKHFEAVYDLPDADEKERLAQLARSLETEIKRDAKLRVEVGGFLEKISAFDIALAVVEGDLAVHGWLLTRIYTDVTRYRADFDQIHVELAEIKRLVANLPPSEDPEALRAYLELVTRRTGRLPLGPLDPSGRENVHVSPGQVFINLNAGKRILSRRLDPEDNSVIVDALTSALGHIFQQRQSILLGDPGSGKSTLLRFLSYCLAQAQLMPDEQWLDHLHWEQWWEKAEMRPGEEIEDVETKTITWSEAGLVPVLVELREFANTAFDPTSSMAVWQFIEKQLDTDQMLAALPALKQKAVHGQLLLMLDGVDEVPVQKRAAFWQAIDALWEGPYGGNRWIATCRVLSFAPDEAPPSIPAVTLEPLTLGQQDDFIAKWYRALQELGELNQEKANDMVQQLKMAVRRERLRPLAENPMLLTIMALVQTYHGVLPDERAKLYQACVETLLFRWQRYKETGIESEMPLVLEELQTTKENLERLLWEIAWTAHKEAGDEDDAVDIPEQEVIQIARRYLDESYSRAEKFVDYSERRAHLLIGRGGLEDRVFAFPHRTFQEYLAACHLASQRRYARRAAELAAGGDSWREVLNLATGTLVFNSNNLEKALDGIECVLPKSTPAPDDSAGWQRVWLSGEMATVPDLSALKRDEVGKEILPKLRRQLVILVEQDALTSVQRAAAGEALGRLGDPRAGVCELEPELFPIPAGSFLMGDGKHAVTIKEPFAIARYPVTHYQYDLFIKDGGYTKKWSECWTNAGWSWRRRRDRRQPWGWNNSDYSLPNQPVIKVTWYEAEAYAGWLKRTTGEPYRLPTEAEWERAARHTDGRAFPWGDEWDANRANSKETGWGRPTVVGCFPGGNAECGAGDMIGNVWEWCQTRWQDEEGQEYPQPYQPDDGREALEGGYSVYRVRKGGSWVTKAPRCSLRVGSSPNFVSWFNGFRLVVSPFFSGR